MYLTQTFPFRSLIIYGLLAVLFVGASAFVLFQARFLITGPQIVLSQEFNGPVNEQRVIIEGTAYNISRLWLNDRSIYTDAQGHFKEAIVLENGYTVATLRAEDRYGRVTIATQPLVFVPASFIQ